MQNGNGGMRDTREHREDKLDDALEDSFPGSDPVSMTQPHGRYGAPKQHSQTAEQKIKDGAQSVKDSAQRIGNRISDSRPDYLWLGGAFVLGCIVGLAARSVPAPRAGYGRKYAKQLQRQLSGAYDQYADSDYAPDQLKKKLSQLLDRLR